MEDFNVVEQLYSNETNKILKIQRQKDNKFFIAKEIDYSSMQEKEKHHIIQEVNIQRELKSPFIVKYYDRYIDKKHQKISIIMEYCQEGDLQSLIAQHKLSGEKVEENMIWKFISQIGQAILELHKRKVVHRDLQPQNIFLDEHRNFKLGDFGVSKIISDQNFIQTQLNEIYYLSPEQINENTFTLKTDIWAFGCLIYELMHLQPPFQGHNQMQIALKIQQGKVDISAKGYSQNLTNFLAWCLTKDAPRRPSIEDIITRPEISYMIRHNRVQENEIILSKKQQDLQLRTQKALQREKQLNERMQEQSSKLAEKQSEKNKLIKIYEESLQELKKIQNQHQKPKNLLYRNHSMEFRDPNYLKNMKQDQLPIQEKNPQIYNRLSIQTGLDQNFQTQKIINNFINQNQTTQNIQKKQLNFLQTKNKHLYKPQIHDKKRTQIFQ